MRTRVPAALTVEFEGGSVEVTESFDVSDMDDDEAEAFAQRTAQMIASVAPEGSSVDGSVGPETVIMEMAYEGSPVEALQGVATEMLMQVAALGGDVDQPWHAAHALNPESGPQTAGDGE